MSDTVVRPVEDITPKRYILVELSDAKTLAEAARPAATAALGRVIDRIDEETGADMEEIATRLKQLSFCPACVIEGQEHTCSSIDAKKLGRRLYRLIDRANAQGTDGHG